MTDCFEVLNGEFVVFCQEEEEMLSASGGSFRNFLHPAKMRPKLYPPNSPLLHFF